jgi:hypothetical protein
MAAALESVIIIKLEALIFALEELFFIDILSHMFEGVRFLGTHRLRNPHIIEHILVKI